ncbi:MAG: hypothetical protein KJO21_07405 [Verrucomicrobiae bacterium]|nr:hypothetical protein [Verrucomicrobiae bacterium]NNJ43299.1 hypothetical protein [Akkermansiaceae bacterium]
MKTARYMLALALATAPSTTFAQQNQDVVTVAKMTFKLTEAYTDAGLAAKDEDGRKIKGSDLVYENEYTKESSKKTVTTEEYGAKMKVEKISNKEILMALSDANVIPGISGWSLVYISVDDEEEEEEVKSSQQGLQQLTLQDDDLEGIAVTDGTQYIGINDYIRFDESKGEAEEYKGKFVTTTTVQGTTEKGSGKAKGKESISIIFDFDDSSAMLHGIINWSETLKTLGKGEDASSLWIPGTTKISALSGHLSVDGNEYPSILEGSISAAAGKVVEFDQD